MAAPRIPYEHIDSTRKVTHDYTRAESFGRVIGDNLGRRGPPPPAIDFLNRRHIPLKRLPYNGLLFHYMILQSDHTIPNHERRRNKLMASILNITNFDSIRYDEGTDRFRICVSRNKPKMKYYYTSPIASFGVAGWGHLYNVEICCRIKREVDVAYLKGGTHNLGDSETDLETITQRGSKFPIDPDFDYLRIKNCHRIPNSCGQVGNINDVCLVGHHDIVDNQISGIYCMAGQDSLISFNNGENQHNLVSQLNGPGRAVRTAFNQIYNNEIRPLIPQINPAVPQTRINYDLYMIYMNSIFLTLEADYRLNNNTHPAAGDTGYLGFSEVTLYALGHYSLGNEQFMPNPARINPLTGNPAYVINNQVANQVTYNVRPNDLAFIYTDFYSEMTIVEIVGITFSHGRIGSVNDIPIGLVPHHNNAAGIEARNRGIFRFGCENFRLHSPAYSVFHNMFISSLTLNGINPFTRRVNVTKMPNALNPNTAADLTDYVRNLTELNLVALFLEKALMFQVNHSWRHNRDGRLIYLQTGAFNHHGVQPSLTQSIIQGYNDEMVANNVLFNNMPGTDTATFIIPGYRQLLTNKYGDINSPLYKLRRFFNEFGGNFLMFSSIITPANILRIINYLNNLPAGRITHINNGAALAGGYRKKTRKYKSNKKNTYRKKNKRI